MKSGITRSAVEHELKKIGGGLEKNPENLKRIFSFIDLTSLNTADNRGSIEQMCLKVNQFSETYPGMPNVAAVCVYPALVHVVRETLKVNEVHIASVGAGFPSSQTFLPVREMECRMAVEAGATEIDIVISVGRFREGDTGFISDEIRRVSEIIRPAKLKVILETGLLKSEDEIYAASMTSLRAGADFIKTSTGKEQPAATMEAVYIMCRALHDFQLESGKMAGIKPAGGISTADQALAYAGIIRAVLGESWLRPSLFRIGASRLANDVLGEIHRLETGSLPDGSFF